MNGIANLLLINLTVAQIGFGQSQHIYNHKSTITTPFKKNFSLEKTGIHERNDKTTNELPNETLGGLHLGQLQSILPQRLLQEYANCGEDDPCFSGDCYQGYCNCWPNAFGDKCQKSCYFCSGHGDCYAHQQCQCNSGWYGETCSKSMKSEPSSSDQAMAVLYILLPIIGFLGSIAYCCYRRIREYKRHPLPNASPQITIERYQLPSNLSIKQQQMISSQEALPAINTSIQMIIPTSNDQFQLKSTLELNEKLEKQEKSCQICLEDIPDQLEKKVNCLFQHSFHRACIDQWLRLHRTCPSCRANIR